MGSTPAPGTSLLSSPMRRLLNLWIVRPVLAVLTLLLAILLRDIIVGLVLGVALIVIVAGRERRGVRRTSRGQPECDVGEQPDHCRERWTCARARIRRHASALVTHRSALRRGRRAGRSTGCPRLWNADSRRIHNPPERSMAPDRWRLRGGGVERRSRCRAGPRRGARKTRSDAWTDRPATVATRGETVSVR